MKIIIIKYQRGSNSTEHNGGFLDDAMVDDACAEPGVDVGVRIARSRHNFESSDHVIGRQGGKIQTQNDFALHFTVQEVDQTQLLDFTRVVHYTTEYLKMKINFYQLNKLSRFY